jgi:hypothetical protein
MIEVIVPSRAEIAALQDREGAYYWSALIEAVLRELGFASVATRSGKPGSDARGVVTGRGTAEAVWDEVAPGSALLAEGPLDPAAALKLGIKTDGFAGEEIAIKWSGGAALQLHYPREFYKNAGVSVQAKEPARWHRSTIAGQFLEGQGWDVLATAQLPGQDAERPIIVAKGSMIVTGLPLFDLYTRSYAFSPLPYRYEKKAVCPGIAPGVVALLNEFERRLAPGERKSRNVEWPEGKKAAFTVRHDFDRPTSYQSMMELLDFYSGANIKASVGFLDYELPVDVMAQIRARGHEIQLHSYAKDLQTYKQQLQAVSAAGRVTPTGMTAHGGPSGSGFLGETQYRWTEICGLRYAERFVSSACGLAPIPYVGEDGIPCLSPLMGLSRHLSLDKSVPNENNFPALEKQVPRALAAGEYVTLMNHPDKNREDLIRLIRGLDLRNVWCATQQEVVDWVGRTRFAQPAAA